MATVLPPYYQGFQPYEWETLRAYFSSANAAWWALPVGVTAAIANVLVVWSAFRIQRRTLEAAEDQRRADQQDASYQRVFAIAIKVWRLHANFQSISGTLIAQLATPDHDNGRLGGSWTKVSESTGAWTHPDFITAGELAAIQALSPDQIVRYAIALEQNWVGLTRALDVYSTERKHMKAELAPFRSGFRENAATAAITDDVGTRLEADAVRLSRSAEAIAAMAAEGERRAQMASEMIAEVLQANFPGRPGAPPLSVYTPAPVRPAPPPLSSPPA